MASEQRYETHDYDVIVWQRCQFSNANYVGLRLHASGTLGTPGTRHQVLSEVDS